MTEEMLKQKALVDKLFNELGDVCSSGDVDTTKGREVLDKLEKAAATYERMKESYMK